MANFEMTLVTSIMAFPLPTNSDASENAGRSYTPYGRSSNIQLEQGCLGSFPIHCSHAFSKQKGLQRHRFHPLLITFSTKQTNKEAQQIVFISQSILPCPLLPRTWPLGSCPLLLPNHPSPPLRVPPPFKRFDSPKMPGTHKIPIASKWLTVPTRSGGTDPLFARAGRPWYSSYNPSGNGNWTIA